MSVAILTEKIDKIFPSEPTKFEWVRHFISIGHAQYHSNILVASNKKSLIDIDDSCLIIDNLCILTKVNRA